MRCVLFDLDGTLIDSSALYGECIRAALGAFPPGPPRPSDPPRPQPASELAYLIEHLGEENAPRAHRLLCEVYEARAATLLGGYYPGVIELLEGLVSTGTTIGIVTGKSRRAYDATCLHLDLARFFDVVVVEDDVPEPKPHPAGILRALEQLGARSDETIYVGDTRMDLEAARRAGMIGAAALWAHPEADRTRIASGLADGVWSLASPADLASRLR